YLGYPVIGDMKYGKKTVNETVKKQYGIKNQVLYCVEVVFPKLDNYDELSMRTVSINEPAVFSKIRN
ncbi:MAG: RluA family pseudouridine synthase, partial [Lachnospiraceae bacterium]|nr:RluA family pseudouridine synthase [Lachnospiraceae bacterium]